MSSVFLYPKGISGKCFKSDFRIVKGLYDDLPDKKPLEVVIGKDYVNGETLMGRPLFEQTRYEGRLYEKLLSLNLSHEGRLSKEEKEKIIRFISKYGSPVGAYISLAGQLEGSHEAEINWAFIPYTIDLEQGGASFFTTFRNMYVDFVETVGIIKSGNLKLLNNYQGTFNIGLEGNKLILPTYPLNDINRLPKWISNSCLNLCYLELYELLSSNQKIKTCKYCNNIFESFKSNELRCNNCKNPDIYRKLYYRKNQDKEQKSARQRMKKLREKSSK